MILVTGGTGFVGRRLVNLLVAAGRPVRVLTRAPDRATVPAEVTSIRGDLGDAASLRQAVAGVDAVVHLAARLPQAGTAAAELAGVNADGAGSLAAAARAAGVQRFVHVSSAGVYGDGTSESPHAESDPPRPGDAYERSKLAGEEAVRAALEGSEVCWTILRPSGVYGAGRRATATLFRQVAQRRLWLHGPTRVIVHPTYVDDVAAAARLAVNREDLRGEVFNVGGERALDYRELIDLIGVRVGRRPRQLAAPGAARRAVAAAAAVFGGARLSRLARPLVNRAIDTSKARRVLGFAPVPLERGLDETAAGLRSAGLL